MAPGTKTTSSALRAGLNSFTSFSKDLRAILTIHIEQSILHYAKPTAVLHCFIVNNKRRKDEKSRTKR